MCVACSTERRSQRIAPEKAATPQQRLQGLRPVGFIRTSQFPRPKVECKTLTSGICEVNHTLGFGLMGAPHSRDPRLANKQKAMNPGSSSPGAAISHRTPSQVAQPGASTLSTRVAVAGGTLRAAWVRTLAHATDAEPALQRLNSDVAEGYTPGMRLEPDKGRRPSRAR